MSESLPRRPAPPRATDVFAALRSPLAILILAGALLGFAVDGRAQDEYGVDDPLEDVNRAVFEFNQILDTLILKPAAEVYVFVLPEEVRHRITNVLRNLGEPLNLANNLAQGKFERAGSTLTRFAINSTMGVGGIFDVATDWGYERVPEDFGQTLGVVGFRRSAVHRAAAAGSVQSSRRDRLRRRLGGGPHGPSPDGRSRPGPRSITSGVSQRAAYLDELETVEQTSVDFYAALRELYRQYRATEIRDGAPPTVMEIP